MPHLHARNEIKLWRVVSVSVPLGTRRGKRACEGGWGRWEGGEPRVEVGMGKKLKQKQKLKQSSARDFKPKKKKVGKVKQLAENATEISFMSKRIILPSQLEDSSQGPTTHRKQSLQVHKRLLPDNINCTQPGVCGINNTWYFI